MDSIFVTGLKKKSSLKEALTTLEVQEKSTKFDNELYNLIEKDLGEITDLEIIPIDSPHYKYQLNYKSNGVLKSNYFSSLTTITASLYYVTELISPVKKYKRSL